MSTVLQDLIAHMRWADERVAASLTLPRSPDVARKIFAHIAAAEHVWWARIQGQMPRVGVWPELSVVEAAELAAECAGQFAALIAGPAETALARVVHYRNSAGVEYHNSVREIVSHVAMHGSHHRGQILRDLRRAGLEPPYVDFIGYVRRDQ